MKALGFLAPNQIQSGLDEPAVREARAELAARMNSKQKARFFPEPETFTDMQRNVETFDAKVQPFNCGDFVYLDLVAKKLQKSTDQKRGEVFIISEIIKSANIPRYKLLNLNKVELPGTSRKTCVCSSIRTCPKLQPVTTQSPCTMSQTQQNRLRRPHLGLKKSSKREFTTVWPPFSFSGKIMVRKKSFFCSFLLYETSNFQITRLTLGYLRKTSQRLPSLINSLPTHPHLFPDHGRQTREISAKLGGSKSFCSEGT